MGATSMKESVRSVMGELYLTIGNLTEAEAAFRCVGDPGGLRALETAYLGSGEFIKALGCRQARGEDWTREERAERGRKLLQLDHLRGAEEAFISAEDVPGLMAVGKKLLAAKKLGEAMRVFNLAGSREDLRSVGKAYIELGQPIDAHRAFQLADDKEGLRAVVEAYLRHGRLDSAKSLARKISFSITDEMLIEVGWHWYREKNFSHASELFIESRCVRGLKAAAQELLSQGDTDAATRIAEEIVRICEPS